MAKKKNETVKGLCLNHPERRAVRLCYTCHKPLCSACFMVKENITFCSEDCYGKYLKFKDKGIGEVKGRSSWEIWSGRILYIVFGLLLLSVLIHVAVVMGVRGLEPIDFLAPILKKF